MTLIINIVDAARSTTSGSKSVDSQSLAANATLFEQLAAILEIENLEYGGLERFPVTNLHPRSNGIPSLLEHTLIKDLKVENFTYNLFHAAFDNGDGHVFLAPSDSESSVGSLQKRGHNGPGFKIVYTTRSHSGLGRSQVADLANGIANAWYPEANGNRMSQYIGLVKLVDRKPHEAVVYFRIIPERDSYGENYETVDLCGGMAGFL